MRGGVRGQFEGVGFLCHLGFSGRPLYPLNHLTGPLPGSIRSKWGGVYCVKYLAHIVGVLKSSLFAFLFVVWACIPLTWCACGRGLSDDSVLTFHWVCPGYST